MLTKCNATIVLTVILLTPLTARALPNWDIFNDAVMDEPDAYNIVNVYDTPPNRTTLTILGGSADYVWARDSSVVNVLGGRVQLAARDQGIANISGGSLSGAKAQDYGVVNFFEDAGSLNLFATDFGMANMFGGTVDWTIVSGSGVMNLYGGTIAGDLIAIDSAVVNVHGSDFGYDPLAGAQKAGQITGLWLDGTSFAIDLAAPDVYAHINFIPEPSTLFLLTIGGLLLRNRR